MPRRAEDLQASIKQATSPEFRAGLLAQGEARGMIWKEGILPEDAPNFDSFLTHDLMSYGYSLLDHGLELIDLEGSNHLSQRAFQYAATAIDAAIARGPSTVDRGFHNVIAAAAFHLARFSARAYSLLRTSGTDQNISVCEKCLVLLMLRDLDGLTELVSVERADTHKSDEHLVEQLSRIFVAAHDDPESSSDASDIFDVVDAALTDAFLGAISMALLAFERGEESMLIDAIERLSVGLGGSLTLSMVPQWWCHRIAIHLLKGLWESSYHLVLPRAPIDGDQGDWNRLRETFIASLFRRKTSEIDLWPSQLEAASRVFETQDNLVLSLPTSAGKTRIAELCTLTTLARGKRVVFVTPLRALSAQTEVALERTFVPLGKSVSSLYGTIGTSTVDESILRDRDIIVATPEKLDFALRNDPDLLNDVGLIVLDEGHMIGTDEREVRYEVQVQRLLRRPDAAARRIICLSAILPDGDQVRDFVGWLTDDQSDGLISSDWRPTTLRFGEVVWQGEHARLNIMVGAEQAFVPRFLPAVGFTSGRRKKPFPSSMQELTLATAWRLIDEGQTVLVFCPQKSSVNAFAKKIVELNRQGALASVFEGDPDALSTALTVGREWFGDSHPFLSCLQLGVAIHHGSLPAPYRKEIENLLQRGVLKITISSPTLAQGLNLSASALVMHSLSRFGHTIEAAEFQNIVGRAGRAYVDSSGLVVHPIFDQIRRKRRKWRELVESTQLRNMESGLVRLLIDLLRRMAQSLGDSDSDALIEYVTGIAAWSFPEIDGENPEDAEEAEAKWKSQLATLDCALLVLLGESAVEETRLAATLDELLSSSLWARSIARRQEPVQTLFHAGLTSRATEIWRRSTATQRRGYYLAGIGLEAGQKLDANAEELNHHLLTAEQCIELEMEDEAIESIVEFARIVFGIFPFEPKKLPHNWEDLLEGWLRGHPVAEIAPEKDFDTFDFIEQALAYQLPWALEAVRVRALAHSSDIDSLSTDSYSQAPEGLAVAAVETGTLNRSASLLMRAGFPTRSGSIAAIESTSADFTAPSGLHAWLNSDIVISNGKDETWPTPTTHELWVNFISRSTDSQLRTWVHRVERHTVSWDPDHQPKPGAAYRAISLSNGKTALETADAQMVGHLVIPLNPNRLGLLKVTASSLPNTVELNYRGPSDLMNK